MGRASKEAPADPPPEEKEEESCFAPQQGLRCEKDQCHDSVELLRFTCSFEPQEEELMFEQGMQMSRRRAYFALVTYSTPEIEEDAGSSDDSDASNIEIGDACR